MAEFKKITRGCVVTLRMGDTVLWTIGHSNRSIEKFLTLLKEHRIKVLVDIRSFPTSKVEHFKREEMERWLLSMELNTFGLARNWVDIAEVDTRST